MGPMLAERSLPGQIIVNGHGSRFMDEAVNYMTAGQIIIGKHTAQDPHIPAWIVFDQRYRNRYLFGAGLFPRQPLPQSWYDAGIAKKAATIAALADALGMPDLPATVDTVQPAGRRRAATTTSVAVTRRTTATTATPPSARTPAWARSTRAPFYAVQVVPGDLGTCGGVRADRYARALRPDGSVIEGLYATGNAAGNAFGRVYPGPGATVGQGLTFGYVAARHLAGRIGADD